jgi:hypothetical protein
VEENSLLKRASTLESTAVRWVSNSSPSLYICWRWSWWQLKLKPVYRSLSWWFHNAKTWRAIQSTPITVLCSMPITWMNCMTSASHRISERTYYCVSRNYKYRHEVVWLLVAFCPFFVWLSFYVSSRKALIKRHHGEKKFFQSILCTTDRLRIISPCISQLMFFSNTISMPIMWRYYCF